jgi:predicted homoserine dehydrogenase-like protein
MIIVDKALACRQAGRNPIRVALIGAGFMGRGIALQIATAVQGMTLVAIYNRHLDGARRAYTEAGTNDIVAVDNVTDLENAIALGRPAITDNYSIVCDAGSIDAIIEVTGTVEFGAAVALRAIEGGKHVVIMNAELDGTLGPQLKRYADSAGVVITNADGDQPGVTMNLYRFVTGIGIRPVLCGNIKGLQDPYRNPTTQEAFARQWKQKAHMVTSFADGTKISFEQAIVANATNMRVAKRGMHGPTVKSGTHVREIVHLYPLEDLLEGPGIVDYVVGAEPGPGVFVLGTHENPAQQHYLNLYKLGEGPLYVFYTPYHLCHFEVPNTVARAVLFKDAAITPFGAPQVDVVATAKRDLKAGEVLDGMGFYMTYGQAENAEVVHRDALLPMGLAEGCRMKCDLARDTVLGYADVVLPENRLSDRIREEQNEHFFGARVQSRLEPSE